MKITKRQLSRIIREESRRLREDHIDTELDNLKKNIADDLEHVKDLKDDIKDDHDEELRAEKEKKKHEALRRRRPLSYRQLRRMIREEHEDWGMGAGEESHTHPGEEDYTGHEGDLSKTHPGEEDYASGHELHVHHHHHHDDQGYDAREDERLAQEHGAEDEFEQSLKDRRDDAGFENESRRLRGRKLREAQLRRIIRRTVRRR